jgi:hypothetical protein
VGIKLFDRGGRQLVGVGAGGVELTEQRERLATEGILYQW